MNKAEKRRELYPDLARMRAESQRLIREHEDLAAKFVRVHGKLDELQDKKNEPESLKPRGPKRVNLRDRTLSIK